jgi:hypothetical protein
LLNAELERLGASRRGGVAHGCGRRRRGRRAGRLEEHLGGTL